ncbi:MAG: zinc ribbon domain-containing protein [Pyrinomonadaceae bacterium]
MSLIFCPECGHEVSANAVACPNCGRPLVAPEPTVVVRRRPDGFPAWGYAAIAGSVILLVLLLILLFRGNNDDSNVNVALRANANRAANLPVTRTDVPPTEPSTVSVPPASGTMPVMPTTSAPPITTTSVPGSSTGAPAVPDKGTAVIQAKVVDRRGNPQPAKSARFYLLDKDPEEILSQAHVQPIEGNSLTSSLGLASVFPDRFGDFQRAAMRAIAAHSKYAGTTDSSGQAKVAGVSPKEYYLFCIFRVGKGFAMWNSPITISAGDNMLDLSPQPVTEIQDTSGE